MAEADRYLLNNIQLQQAVLIQAKTNLYLAPCLLFIFSRIVVYVTAVATGALYACDRI